MRITFEPQTAKRAYVLLILWVLLATAVCGEANYPEHVGVTVEIDTVAGVEYVRSNGTPVEWRLETVLELGESGGPAEPGEREFAWVSSVAVGPDGNLYVADLGENRIAVFDTTGVLKYTIGRKGRGPGEFLSVYSIQWLGDTLMTMDLANARVGLLSRDGEWLSSRPAIGRLVASPVTFRLYSVGPREVYQFAYRHRDGLSEPTWIRHGPSGAIDEWQRGGDAPLESSFADKVVCTMGRGFSWFDHPYATRWLEHPAPGSHAYSATSNAYRVALVNAKGDTVRMIERLVEQPLLTDGEWLPISRRFQEWLKDKTPSQCQPRSLERPERKPHLETLLVDTNGRLWVERNLEHGTGWEIFDPSGQLVAYVRGLDHDRQRTVPWLGNHHIAWVSRDSMDVPKVHLARIAR